MALEVPNVSSIIANDISPEAVSLIAKNAAHNNVASIVNPVCYDAIELMLQHRSHSERFNVVDIDPFGTASPFLDSAVQCLHGGGLLCVTSTDMAVLCGSTPGTSMGKYGGIAIKTGSTHEVGLRILLNALQLAASRHGKIIEPLLSLSVDFYARVFVRVWSSPLSVKAIAAKHGICYVCSGCLLLDIWISTSTIVTGTKRHLPRNDQYSICNAYHIQPLGIAVDTNKVVVPAHGPPVGLRCTECGSRFYVFGPIWIGPLHNRTFLYEFLSDLGYPPKNNFNISNCPNEKSHSLTQFNTCEDSNESKVQASTPYTTNKHYGTLKRIIGMTTVAYEELPDVPLYYIVDRLASVYAHYERNRKTEESGLQSDDDKTSEKEMEASEKASVWSRRQLKKIRRTNEGIEIPCDMKESDAESKDISNRQTVRIKLLARPINPSISFNHHPLADPPSKCDGLVRYQVNPEKNWGPKSKPKMNALT
ncbi:hypothetical protein KSF78_0004941 [Schistosoma japonicum]|nr:hypothetical protein KSF78_0004941 [Schistosoma japonicum]